MTVKNVISISNLRKLKNASLEDPDYQSKIENMEKAELLNEMIRFQEERSQLGHLTLGMMVRGKILFKELELSAETEELKILTQSYKRHLEFELEEFLKQKQKKQSNLH